MITMDVAVRELQNIISPDKPKEITPQLVIEIVAEHFNISTDQMIYKNRSSEIAKPRQIAMYLCKNMTSAQLETIGALLGGRDHSTIIHGIKKITEEYQNDENFHHLIENVWKEMDNPYVCAQTHFSNKRTDFQPFYLFTACPSLFKMKFTGLYSYF